MSALLNDMRSALDLLEAEMRQIGWWQEQAPSAQALASKEPFCVDYLTFSQWLQWVYTPKMHSFMNQTGRLPERSHLMPIAEEAWKGSQEDCRRLLKIVALLDALIMGGHEEKWQALQLPLH